ncbi:MAG: DUF4003 family protein [Gammaproteobacteria bacterium]|nr:DUF4003 family protein [Gammaproteobacteria bacterium]
MGPTSDPVEEYFATLERLRARKRWSTDMATVRFAALALGAARTDTDVDRLEEAAATLRARAGWTSPLRSEVRHVVAAMVVREGLDPDGLHERVLETREALRSHRLPRSKVGTTFAALVLLLRSGGEPVPGRQLERLATIWRRWREEHFWLTGADDLPAAALHACGEREVEMLVADVERAYARLREAGFRRGNGLQWAAQVLAVDPRGVETGVERFRRVAERLRRSRVRVGRGRYDEAAILALVHEDVAAVVDRALDYRERLRANKPRPGRDLAFTVAVGLAFAGDARRAADRVAGDLAALHSIQAILSARRAAAASAAGAGAAAHS